jgi:hypothetical protein
MPQPVHYTDHTLIFPYIILVLPIYIESPHLREAYIFYIYDPGVDSASNRNEYQEYFLGVNAAGA